MALSTVRSAEDKGIAILLSPAAFQADTKGYGIACEVQKQHVGGIPSLMRKSVTVRLGRKSRV